MSDKKHAKKENVKEKDEKQEKIDELTDMLKRTQAEFENVKKRNEKITQELIKNANEALIKKFLPILDNLELALKHSNNQDDFYQGIEMIYANIRSMLEEEGIKVIEALGLPFDPYRHEALLTKDSEKEKNTVIEVMQSGYEFNNKIIRPAKVMISK